jgi:predicted nuclease of predicted toxin-antitoxin system
MPRTIRFHLDEHVAHAVADGLRLIGVDATTTTDAALVGAPDVQQLAFTVAAGRVLFTEDRDFLGLAAAHQHCGIAYCDQNARSIGQIVRGLQLIWEVYEPAEMHNRIEFL